MKGLIENVGFSLAYIGFTGFYWVLLGFTGFSRVLLGFPLFLLKIHSFRWALPSSMGLNGLKRVVLGFYSVASCWTRLSLVEPCCTEFFYFTESCRLHCGQDGPRLHNAIREKEKPGNTSFKPGRCTRVLDWRFVGTVEVPKPGNGTR